MTREQLINLFNSSDFRERVKRPYIYEFIGEYPEISKGYYEKDGNKIYIDYSLSSSESSAWSLIITINKDGYMEIRFDTDDGAAKWEIEDRKKEGYLWRKLDNGS